MRNLPSRVMDILLNHLCNLPTLPSYKRPLECDAFICPIRRGHKVIAGTKLTTECSHPGSRSLNREAIKYRFDGSPLIGPEKRKKKAIRTARCLSAASFGLFRFLLSIAGSEPAPAKAGANLRGRLFVGYLLLAKQKKVTAPAA